MQANIVDLASVLSAMSRRPYCETGELPIEMEAQSVVRNGERLGYFEASLKRNITMNFGIGKGMEQLGLNVSCSP